MTPEERARTVYCELDTIANQIREAQREAVEKVWEFLCERAYPEEDGEILVESRINKKEFMSILEGE